MNSDNYCIAGRLRMLSRIITGRYNEAFAAEGVTFAQAGLLMRIFAQPGIRQTALAKQLQIDLFLSLDVDFLKYDEERCRTRSKSESCTFGLWFLEKVYRLE